MRPPGVSSRSTIQGEQPARASATPAARPAGPAPSTTTSALFASTPWLTPRRGRDPWGSLRVFVRGLVLVVGLSHRATRAALLEAALRFEVGVAIPAVDLAVAVEVRPDAHDTPAFDVLPSIGAEGLGIAPGEIALDAVRRAILVVDARLEATVAVLVELHHRAAPAVVVRDGADAPGAAAVARLARRAPVLAVEAGHVLAAVTVQVGLAADDHEPTLTALPVDAEDLPHVVLPVSVGVVDGGLERAIVLAWLGAPAVIVGLGHLPAGARVGARVLLAARDREEREEDEARPRHDSSLGASQSARSSAGPADSMETRVRSSASPSPSVSTPVATMRPSSKYSKRSGLPSRSSS